MARGRPSTGYKYERLRARLEQLVSNLAPGVPLPTVRALMREHNVSQVTIERVLTELERRNLVVREPRKRILRGSGCCGSDGGKPVRIALVLPVASSHFGRRIIHALESKAGDAVSVSVFESRNSLEKELELIGGIGNDFSGVIIRPAVDTVRCVPNPRLEDELQTRLSCPYVLLDAPWLGRCRAGLGFRSYDAMAAATDLLIDRGVRRIACIPYFESLDDLETFNAVRAAVNRLDAGIDLTVSHLGRSMERKERETIDLLARKPDAVIVTYPPFVYFVEKAIVSLGIRVPDETLVVSVVEDDYSEYVRIPVIAIRRRTAKLAEFALDALLAKIRFRSSPTDLDLASELIVPPEIQSYLDESGGGMLKKFRTVAVSGLT